MRVGPGEARLARGIKIESTKIIEVSYTPSVAEIGPADDGKRPAPFRMCDERSEKH